jgi:hypothetical protein
VEYAHFQIQGIRMTQISKGVRWFVHGSLIVLAIWLGSTYLIERAMSPTRGQTGSKSEPIGPPANDAKFRALFDSGNKALRDGQYGDALASFTEAEHSAERLSDDQYDALKKSRQQIAQLYETSGYNSEAGAVYRALATCAIRQAQSLFNAKEFDGAVVRARDAEQFSDPLTEGKQASLQQSIYLLANSLAGPGLHRYSEAVEATQRMIDYLKASDADDKVLADNYINLASSYAEAKDWYAFEHSLVLAIDSCDRALGHLSTDSTAGYPLRLSRNWAQYNLVIAYYRQGNTDAALSKADDLYTEALERRDPGHPLAYSAQSIASLALQIAADENKKVAIDLWRTRGGTVAGSLNVVAIRPVATQ